jgi:phosphoglycolate phosphatase/putative hydrolase of the HAD superfamily
LVPHSAKALIFDVDGTLYDQERVRRGMFWRLLRAHLGQPIQGLSTLRALRAYRNAQEFLRICNAGGEDVSEAQVKLASELTGIQKKIVASTVSRWMEKEPLDLVARSIRHGVSEFVQHAKNHGLRLAVFSDYPAAAKLDAMRLTPFFDVVVSAQDPEVRRFKPDARGIEVTLRRLNVAKDRVLYIGDRPDVDAAAAFRAGITCVIIGQKRNRTTSQPWLEVSDYHELRALVCRS